MAWTLRDFTGPKGGYFQLDFNGEPVCDFFPFARGADPALVRARAEYITSLLNNGVAAETARCAEIARSLEAENVAAAIEMGALVISTHTGGAT